MAKISAYVNREEDARDVSDAFRLCDWIGWDEGSERDATALWTPVMWSVVVGLIVLFISLGT